MQNKLNETEMCSSWADEMVLTDTKKQTALPPPKDESFRAL